MHDLKVGRLLIWAGLYEHMGGARNLRGYKLVRNDRGKPLLVNALGCEDQAVSFNISHQVNHCTHVQCNIYTHPLC